MVQAPLSTSVNPTTSEILGESEKSVQVWLLNLAEQIIAGKRLDREEAIALTKIEGTDNILLLCQAADLVRKGCCGNTVDLCSIINVKSGNCSENCGFCAQSAHHPAEDSPIYGLKSTEEILTQAKSAELAGAKRFCLVSQGRGLNIPARNQGNLNASLKQ